jgi:hypothetical protein
LPDPTRAVGISINLRSCSTEIIIVDDDSPPVDDTHHGDPMSEKTDYTVAQPAIRIAPQPKSHV